MEIGTTPRIRTNIEPTAGGFSRHRGSMPRFLNNHEVRFDLQASNLSNDVGPVAYRLILSPVSENKTTHVRSHCHGVESRDRFHRNGYLFDHLAYRRPLQNIRYAKEE